jgi:phospholipase A2-like protein
MRRTLVPRTLGTLLLSLATTVAVLVVASPAQAVTADQKLALLSSFTQASTASYTAWNAARTNQSAYAAYALDWSTDYCSDSPDEPLGFDFRIPCWRHDFGYRNYKAVSAFPANKAHIDDAFYFDLKAKCATYSVIVRPACDSLAWTYYEAVHELGSIAVSTATIGRIAQQYQTTAD